MQRIHPKTAHAVDSEGEAAESRTGAEWCPKGTRRPGAVTFQCRRRYGLPLENREGKVRAGDRPQKEDGGWNIRWQADELSLTMERIIRKVEAEGCTASLVTAHWLGHGCTNNSLRCAVYIPEYKRGDGVIRRPKQPVKYSVGVVGWRAQNHY